MPEEELGAVSDEDDALDEPEAEELDERGAPVLAHAVRLATSRKGISLRIM